MATGILHDACAMCRADWRTAGDDRAGGVQEVRWTRRGGQRKGRRGGQIGKW